MGLRVKCSSVSGMSGGSALLISHFLKYGASEKVKGWELECWTGCYVKLSVQFISWVPTFSLGNLGYVISIIFFHVSPPIKRNIIRENPFKRL